MNLISRLKAFWRDTEPEQAALTSGDSNEAKPDGEGPKWTDLGTGATLIEFPTAKTTLNAVAGQQSLSSPDSKDGPAPFFGLLHSQELDAFFSDNFFGFGCHNGMRLRTEDGLALGVQTIVSRFQRLVSKTIESKRARINRIEREVIRVRGLDAATTRQLELAVEQLKKDIDTLNEQIDLASREAGWVRNAIDQYRSGFLRGVRDAVEIELLGLI